jgi:hypothetical protein
MAKLSPKLIKFMAEERAKSADNTPSILNYWANVYADNEAWQQKFRQEAEVKEQERQDKELQRAAYKKILESPPTAQPGRIKKPGPKEKQRSQVIRELRQKYPRASIKILCALYDKSAAANPILSRHTFNGKEYSSLTIAYSEARSQVLSLFSKKRPK